MNKITDFPPLLRRIAAIIAVFLSITSLGYAQDSTGKYTFRVLLRDKGAGTFAPSSALYRQTEALHTTRCIERRKKVMPANALFTIADAPVFQPYIDSVKKFGAQVLLTLRWNNYLVVKCDSTTASAISTLPFVEAVHRTASKLTRMTASTPATPWIVAGKDGSTTPSILRAVGCGAFRYGPSLNQAAMLGIPELHAMGITGDSALIGFLDSGFRWKVHNATKNANVIAEHDFIFGDGVTANEEPDISSQDEHGSICFSTVSGYQQDSLIGIAPNASFVLAKTEDIPTESHIEEDNYAAGLEWEESLGVDVTSSSLGYSVFNQPDEDNYSYGELNGHTTIVANAVNKAVMRGVTCITAAGNEGPRAQTLISPADADSSIAVAGLQPDGNTTAGFSSRGPNGGGKIKPDIAAQAVNVVCIVHYAESGLRGAGGTSLATPLIAGSAGLIMSVFPEITPYQLRTALFATGSQGNAKDDTLGYGKANIPAAMLRIGTIVSRGYATYPVGEFQRFCFYIRTKFQTVQPRIVFYPDGSIIPQYFILTPTDAPYQFIADIPRSAFAGNGKGRFFVEVTTSGDRRTMPYFAGTDETTLDVAFGDKITSCGINENTLPLSPNILNSVDVTPNVVDAGRETVSVTIPLESETPFTVEAYNSAGMRVWGVNVPAPHAGVTTCYIPSAQLAVGFYFVHVRAGNKTMLGVLVRM